jgi:hypothetical protein
VDKLTINKPPPKAKLIREQMAGASPTVLVASKQMHQEGDGKATVTSQDFIKFWGNFFCFLFECVD